MAEPLADLSFGTLPAPLPERVELRAPELNELRRGQIVNIRGLDGEEHSLIVTRVQPDDFYGIHITLEREGMSDAAIARARTSEEHGNG